MAITLTKAQIEKAVRAGCPTGRANLVLWDGNVTGLGLKIRPSGRNTWVLSYRPKGGGRNVSARTITIGSWPGVTLDAARTAARGYVGEIAKGDDPAVALRTQRTRAFRLVGKSLEDYEAHLQLRHVVNVKTIMSTLRRGLEPLKTREIDKLTRAEIVDRIDAREAAGMPGAAADLRTHTRSYLEWAVGKGLTPYNVMAGLRRPRMTRAQKVANGTKGKALSDTEIVSVWRAADTMGAFGALVKLGILTAMRRGELAGLRWCDIGDDRITLHAKNTKTGEAHEIPLTIPMKTILQAQPKHASTDLVFPSPRRNAGAALSGWSQMVAKLVSASGVHLTLHDTRRTCRTLMSRCGMAEDMAELAIGHVRADLVGRYNHDNSWQGRIAAFEAVSAHITAALAERGSDDTNSPSAKVVPRASKSKPNDSLVNKLSTSDADALTRAAEGVLLGNHRWLPQSSAARANLRRYDENGTLTKGAAAKVKMIAVKIMRELDHVYDCNLPTDPVEAACLLAAGIYLSPIDDMPTDAAKIYEVAAIIRELADSGSRETRKATALEGARARLNEHPGGDHVTQIADRLVREHPSGKNTLLARRLIRAARPVVLLEEAAVKRIARARVRIGGIT